MLLGKCADVDRVSAAESAAECKEEEVLRNTHARQNSDHLEVPTSLLTGISFKCQIIHLEQVTETFRDLLGECQTGP